MFWGPRPPESSARSRSVEGDRQQQAAAVATAAGVDPGAVQAPDHCVTPAGPAHSAPVTPTVVSGRGAQESPTAYSPGDSPQDGQYRQTLRRLTGDIHGLLQRAEADDEEADDGFGDGVVDGDAVDGDGAEDGDNLTGCSDVVDGDQSFESDGNDLMM